MAEALTGEVDADPRLLPELAYHWFAAEQHREALGATVRAGALAVRMRAFQEAEVQYQRALQLWSRVPDPEAVAGAHRGEVLGLAADAARWAGHVHQAVAWVRQAIGDVAAEADPGRTGELYERLGSYQWEASAVDQSVEAYREADRLLTGRPPTAASSRVRSALATAAVRAGRHTEGLRFAQQAVEEARSIGARSEEGRAMNSAGLALTMLDRPEEGLAALREALQIAIEVDNLEDTLRAYGNLGLCLEHAGMVHDAVEILLEGLERARSLGVLSTRQGGVLANNASVSLFLLGRWSEATVLLEEVLLNRPATETLYQRLTRAEIEVARGRYEEAEHLLADVRSRPNTDPRFVGPLYCCIAELASQRSDYRAAREAVAHGIEAVADAENNLVVLQLCAVGLRAAADESLKSAYGRNDPAGQKLEEWVEVLLGLVQQSVADSQPTSEPGVLALLGAAECSRLRGLDAPDRWIQVGQGWAGLDRPYPLAYALFREAESHARSGNTPAASAAIRAARATAERVGAQPLIEQVDRLVSERRLSLEEPAEPAEPKERPFGLTARELEILEELVKGRTNKAIAKDLYIAESTVSVHVSNTYKKMGVESRTAATAKAFRHGIFGA